MNYLDLSTEIFDTSDISKYPNYLNIRDEEATTETLVKFLDIGKDDHVVTTLILYSLKIKTLPKGIFKYFKNIRNIQISGCNELEVIEELPEVQEVITIWTCPKLSTLPTTFWNNDKIKRLQLENLPLLQIPKKGTKKGSLLAKGIQLIKRTTGQTQTTSIYQDWHFPNLKSLTLTNIPIQTLPIIHAELLYGCKIQIDDFEQFDPQQLKFPKLDSLTIKSKVFNQLDGLNNMRLQFLELHNVEVALDWSDLLLHCYSTFLTLTNCSSFTTSKDIVPNSKVRILHLKNCEVFSLPEFIGKCSGLNQLLLSDCPISTLPVGLSDKKKMSEIRLYKCRFKEIPPVIFKMPLERFSLNDNLETVVDFPKDWSGCANLWGLEFRNNNYVLPDLNFLDDLPRLKSLRIAGNTLADRYSLLRKKKLPLEKDSYAILKGCKYTKRAEVITACRTLANAKIPEEDKRYFLDTIWSIKKMSDFPAPSDALLLKGLCVSWSPMNTYFKEVLAKRIEAHNEQGLMFSADSVITTVGKLTLKKAELQTKIEEIGAQYVTKFSTKVSHVIIGKHPNKFDLFEHKNIQLCTEQQFQSYMTQEAPQFLQQPENTMDAQMMDNLYALLKNPDPSNFEIAIQMLKNGGVPNGMLEDLLILQKTHESAPVKRKIKDLLKLYGPAEWHPILNDRHSFTKLSNGTEQEWVATKKLRKIAVQTAPKYAVMLSILLYKKFGKGLRYALLQQGKVEDDLYQNIINDLVQEGTLNWSKAIGMRSSEKLDYAGEYAHSYYVKTAKIPVKLLENTKVSKIILEDCGLEQVPKEVFVFSEITAIHLSKNRLSELPNDFKKLKHLSELDLSHNEFREFPAHVFELKELKKINFTGNPWTGDVEKWRLEVQKKLPNCELIF